MRLKLTALLALVVMTMASPAWAGPLVDTTKDRDRRGISARHLRSEVIELAELKAGVFADKPVKRKPKPKPAPEPTPEPETESAEAETAPVASIWLALADCETGDSDGLPPYQAVWNYNGSSGFDGGLQFMPSTWDSLDTGYAYAYQAPPAVQIAAAQKLQAQAGWDQWPGCSAKLGLD